jgi:CRISPR-associated protein Csm5
MDPGQKDLKVFLDHQNVGLKDYAGFIRYSIDAGEAAYSQRFRGVLTFMKDGEGYPYIPGSSLKGALRTAIGAKLLQKDVGWDYHRTNVERGIQNYRGAKKYLESEEKSLNQKIFEILNIKNPKSDERLPGPINDIMRGIQVSDSRILDHKQLTLIGKYDRKPDGSYHLLPIFRECLIPGSEAHFSVTLETSILEKAGLNRMTIEDALHTFSDMYYENFEQFFRELPEDASVQAMEGVDIIMGGGTGFVSKTMTYNLYQDRGKALQLVCRILSNQFPKHKHNLDVSKYKVSPHILKTTLYKGQYYQMGRCELVFE